jgi:glycosyltransferase involved in cell wall biosynthesis
MPAYNAQAFLPQAIESVLAQTYPHWELWVANDGSTDDTKAIVLAYAAKDDRIKLVDHTANSGTFGAMRNAAFAASSGAYIANLDSDDEFEPDALAHLVAHLDANPQCPMVYGCYGNIDEQGQPCPQQIQGIRWAGNQFVCDPTGPFNPTHIHVLAPHTWQNLLLWRVDNHVQGMLFRRTFLTELSLEAASHDPLHAGPWLTQPPMQYLADFHLTIRAYHAQFNTLHALPVAVFRYRQITSGTSMTYNPAATQKKLDAQLTLLAWAFKLPLVQQTVTPTQQADIICTNVAMMAWAARKAGNLKGVGFLARKLWQQPGVPWHKALLTTAKIGIRLIISRV